MPFVENRPRVCDRCRDSNDHGCGTGRAKQGSKQENRASVALIRGNGLVLGGRGWLSGARTEGYIESEAVRCFGQESSHRVFAVSNGAYAAGELWKHGQLPNAIDFFMIGGAPPLPGENTPSIPKRLAFVLIGSGDKHHGPGSAASSTRWAALGAPLTQTSYTGGHRFLAEAFSALPTHANIRSALGLGRTIAQ